MYADRRGSVAIEFAFVAPILVLLLFGVVVCSYTLLTYSSIQQLAAESARSAVSGLSSAERDQIARAFVATNASAYPALDPTKLTVATSTTSASFSVTLAYDMRGSLADSLSTLVPIFSRTVSRTAVIGGISP